MAKKPAAAPKPAAPDAPPESSTAAPAPEQMQEQAGAGESAAAPESPTPRAPRPGLRITCTHEGFRRAGRPWSKAPTDVALDEFSAEQVAMLRAEPRLIVEDIELA